MTAKSYQVRKNIIKPIEIKKSFLTVPNSKNNREELKSVLQGKDTDREDIKKELKRIMIEEGLSIRELIKEYKSIIRVSGSVKYRGSDVVKVIENLTKLHGIEDKNDGEDKFRALLQSKSEDEIKTILIETTNKTMEYLTRLDTLQKKQ